MLFVEQWIVLTYVKLDAVHIFNPQLRLYLSLIILPTRAGSELVQNLLQHEHSNGSKTGQDPQILRNGTSTTSSVQWNLTFYENSELQMVPKLDLRTLFSLFLMIQSSLPLIEKFFESKSATQNLVQKN